MIGLSLALTRAALPGFGLSLDNYGPSNPLYIAHRGGALMYPEETTEGYATSYADGNRALEMDVQALSDGALVLMHDSTVDRTTTSTGNVSSFDTAGWQSLAIDANTWFGGNFGNALVPPMFGDIINQYKGRVIFAPEAKAIGTGTPLIAALQAAGISTKHALVQSTFLAELAPAVSAGYPALLITDDTTSQITAAQSAGVTWAAISSAATSATCSAWIAAGFKVAVYEVHRRVSRDKWLALGVSGIFSDDPQYVAANSPFASSDSYASGRWMRGMTANAYDLTHRGNFTAPDKFSLPVDSTNFTSVLQGWACPIKGDTNGALSFTIDFKVTFVATATDDTKWASVFLGKNDNYFPDGAASDGNLGFHFLLRKGGQIQIYKRTASASTQVASTNTAAIPAGGEVAYRIVMTPSSVSLYRLDGSGNIAYTATVADSDIAYRGGYLSFCRNGVAADFRAIAIT